MLQISSFKNHLAAVSRVFWGGGARPRTYSSLKGRRRADLGESQVSPLIASNLQLTHVLHAFEATKLSHDQPAPRPMPFCRPSWKHPVPQSLCTPGSPGARAAEQPAPRSVLFWRPCWRSSPCCSPCTGSLGARAGSGPCSQPLRAVGARPPAAPPPPPPSVQHACSLRAATCRHSIRPAPACPSGKRETKAERRHLYSGQSPLIHSTLRPALLCRAWSAVQYATACSSLQAMCHSCNRLLPVRAALLLLLLQRLA